jgi:hypothetical protein
MNKCPATLGQPRRIKAVESQPSAKLHFADRCPASTVHARVAHAAPEHAAVAVDFFKTRFPGQCRSEPGVVHPSLPEGICTGRICPSAWRAGRCGYRHSLCSQFSACCAGRRRYPHNLCIDASPCRACRCESPRTFYIGPSASRGCRWQSRRTLCIASGSFRAGRHVGCIL